MRTGKSDMMPPNPEIHDYLMSESDDHFIALREQYPALDEVIGEENFTEVREGSNPNAYSVVLLLDAFTKYIEVKKYSDYIIDAHKKNTPPVR